MDHGYAATIQMAQGVTVDRAHVLASSGLDRHASYVALTRLRQGVSLHYGADQFAGRRELSQVLGRERAKDTTSDYPVAFAERRGIGRAGYAAARAEVERTIRQELPVPDRQQEAMVAARGALAQLSPEAAADLRAASGGPGMAERAATPARTGEVMRAMEQEAEVRRSPELRAVRFVEDWRKLDTQREGLFRFGDRSARQAVEARMGRLAYQLKGDPELWGALGERRKELGLGARSQGRPIDDELARSVGRDRGRER